MFLTTQDSAMCPWNPGRSTTSYFDKISISDPYDSTLINWSRCPDKQPSKFFPSFHWSLVACAPAAGFRSPSSNSLAGAGQQVIRCAIWTDDHKGVFLLANFCNFIFGLIFNLMFWGCNCYKNHHDSSIPHLWWWWFSMIPRSCGFQTMLTPTSMVSRLWRGTAFGTSPPPTPSAATTAALQRGPPCNHLVLSLIIFSFLWLTECRNYCSLAERSSL